jgi:thiaminase (transcriptional activator TenA)
VAEWESVTVPPEKTPASTPTEELRASVRDDWDAAVNHPFVRDLFAGTLPMEAMRRYLVQDYQFVDAFVALLGATVACADAPSARMVLARQLGVVAGPENTYFERSFDSLGVSDRERTDPELLPPTVGFLNLMSEAADSRDYAACLAVLTVAEWLYLDWASQASKPLPADPIASEWIELHNSPPFAVWVTFLRGELDRLVPHLTSTVRARCTQIFATATRLELDFFEAAYQASR